MNRDNKKKNIARFTGQTDADDTQKHNWTTPPTNNPAPLDILDGPYLEGDAQ